MWNTVIVRLMWIDFLGWEMNTWSQFTLVISDPYWNIHVQYGIHPSLKNKYIQLKWCKNGYPVCRIVLGPQDNNYYDALVQLKIQQLEVRRSELFMKFGRKLLGSSSRFRDMLPPERENSFQLRKSNTERYKRSAIPFLAKVLYLAFICLTLKYI